MELNVNGVTLYYEVIGSGDPLVMIHGNGESREIFYEAAEKLKAYFTVYLIDSRGHGKSSPVSEYHYRDMAEDIRTFIEALRLERPYFYGFSDGGILGLLLAAGADPCRQYIISGANARPEGVGIGLRLMLRMMNLFKKDPLITLMLREPDISGEELAAIRTEVVILAGKKDLILETHTRHLHEMIPGSRLEIIPGRGHGDYIVHSTEIADLILKYTGKRGADA